jgi:hypothetical protein
MPKNRGDQNNDKVFTGVWSMSIDPRTIPDNVLKSEWARRANAKRTQHGAGTGRPKVLKTCDRCGVEILGAREFREHRANHASL